MRSAVVILAATLFCLFAGPACAAKRVALVIGMSKYQQVPQLANPTRDADAMTSLFKDAGFELVDSERDLGIADLRRVIRQFAEAARDADIAVVYYAGHGMEVDGNNYLIPTDAKLLSDFDVQDETMSLDRVLRTLDSVKRLKLIILDACRDNPFAKTMKRSIATRSVGRGLAEIEPSNSDTLVAFAAKAGAVASDGDGQNSPFATALVKHLTEPGLDLRIAFGRVRDDVLKSTGNRQEPFVYGSLGGDTMALVPQKAPAVDPEAQARVDYELAAQIGTKEAWDSFLVRHGKGYFADLARAQTQKLTLIQETRTKADDARRDAEALAAQKAAEYRKQIEEQSARETAAAKQKLSEQARKELEEERRQFADQAKREMDEAKRQVELAQQQADAARQQVEDAKRQAAAEAKVQIDQAKQAIVDSAAADNTAKEYELAAQVGTKEAWDSFLSRHNKGYFAELARAQTQKVAVAQETRARADDARREAEALAAQKAADYRKQLEEQSARETAAAKQKLSEQARKELEEERRQLADQARREMDEAKRQVELAQQQAEAARQQLEQAKRQAADDAKVQVKQATAEEKIASLNPSQSMPQVQALPPASLQMDPEDIARLLQAHLKRVGCKTGSVDGNWDESSRSALALFNKNAGTQFDVKLASLDALDAVRAKTDRVCPLSCGKGQRVDGDRCVQIGCRAGFFLNSSGACEKRPEPAPAARTTKREPAERPAAGGAKCFNFGGKHYCE